MTRTEVRAGLLAQWHWGVAYGMILFAWAGLWVLAVATHHASPVLRDLTTLPELLLTSHAHHASYTIMLGMWMAMSVAMMLPGYIPVLRTYEMLQEAGVTTRAGFTAITSGYLAVWAVYSVAMSLVSLGLEVGPAEWMTALGESRLAAGLLLFGAGLYQLSPFKDECLRKCRNPLTILLARGLGNPGRDFMTGIIFGLWCLGCCWLLMGVGLIAGLMSMAWMGLAMVIITLEKLPQLGRFVTRPLSAVLIVMATGTVVEMPF